MKNSLHLKSAVHLNPFRLIKTLFISSLLLISMTSVSAQQWHWANTHSSTQNEESVVVASNASGDVYVAHTFSGSINAGTDSYPLPADDGKDVILAKYSVDGQFQWSNTIRGEGSSNANPQTSDWVYDIEADDSGVYIIGNFGPNANVFGQTILDINFFIAKLDNDGNMSWLVSSTHSGVEHAFTELGMSPSGDLLVSGLYTTDGELLSIGNLEIEEEGPFLLKVNPSNGALLDAADGLPFRIDRMAALSEELVAVSSYYEGAHHLGMLDFTSGELNWQHQFEDLTNGPESRSLGIFINDDQEIEYVFKSGSSNDIDFGNGLVLQGGFNDNGVLMVLDSDGSVISGKRLFDQFEQPINFLDSAGFSQRPFIPRKAIKDELGGFYLTGTLTGPRPLANGEILITDLDFNQDPDLGSKDAVVLRLDSDFNITEKATETGTAAQEGYDITRTLDGDIVMVGIHAATSLGSMDLTTVFGDTQFDETSGGFFDVFVTRLRTTEFGEIIDNVTEINELGVKLYPNSASDVLHLELENGVQGEVRIADSQGRSVIKEYIDETQTLHTFSVADLANGFYQVSIFTATGIKTMPLMVSH